MHSHDPHLEPGRPVAVGDKLALRRNNRWEPVTIAALTEPGRVRVRFDGYLSTYKNNYAHSSHAEEVGTAELRSREGINLHWQYRVVLRWTAIVFVVALGLIAGALLVLNQGPRGRDSGQTATRNWAEGDAVSILWEGKWYAGKIISRQGDGNYYVSYDGYDDEWNEVVDASRLRPPAGDQ